jgi:hypothetical protein
VLDTVFYEEFEQARFDISMDHRLSVLVEKSYCCPEVRTCWSATIPDGLKFYADGATAERQLSPAVRERPFRPQRQDASDTQA